MDVVCLLVLWTNYHYPVPSQNGLQLDLYVFGRLVLIVSELAARALDSHYYTILHVLWNLRPLDGVYLGVDKLLRNVGFHYGYIGRELYCFMIAYFNQLDITADQFIHITYDLYTY